MPALTSYPYDLTVTDKDAWIGTDSTTRKTKQYTASSVANYLNTNGKVSIGGQVVYMFSTLPLTGAGTFALPGGGGAGTSFSGIDTLVQITPNTSSGMSTPPTRNITHAPILN